MVTFPLEVLQRKTGIVLRKGFFTFFIPKMPLLYIPLFIKMRWGIKKVKNPFL